MSEADELTAEPAASYWRAYDQRLAETGFGAVARQLPGLIGQATRLGWEANRRDTVAAIGLNLVSGVLTGFALLATTGVLAALFAAGPTPHRVRAALPCESLPARPRPARLSRRRKGSRVGMLAIVAAIIFAIAWILNATGTATNAWFSVTDLLLIGLACLALHQAGIGTAWVRRR